MSDLRQEARELIEQMPEEKLIYIIQIMQGINGLFDMDEKDNRADKRKNLIALDEFVSVSGRTVEEVDAYIRELRDNDRL